MGIQYLCTLFAATVVAVLTVLVMPARAEMAEDEADKLAMQLANPVAALISCAFSIEFVSEHYQRFKYLFHSKHEKKPKPIKGLDGIYSLKRLSEI